MPDRNLLHVAILQMKPYGGQASSSQIKEYQGKVGSCNYPSCITRGDVAHAVSQLSEFLTNSGPEHIVAANRVIKYLYYTRFLALEYSPTGDDAKPREAANDASYGDRPDRKKLSWLRHKIIQHPNRVEDYQATHRY
ncbi:hypothetical protein N7478_012186 [Penicillium angulare]|uniref:uncharacterized protein n=1 Tax=Penicillium angulare TaxID=116970 RepID=UPI0025403E25|nr:uncharacterized protein N7478_012186 [Penicillium angulare]KAJ5260581.1 hypothetical protein N7478_012186 [Penicillium angulare]